MPSPDPRLMELSRIFSGIKFFLARGIPTTTIEHLRELLIERGGLESEHMKDATHVISPSDCFIGDDEAKKAVIVTPAWVERSAILGKLQDPRYYSADPIKIFSGVVATSSDLPPKDSESIAAGIMAFGGQWKEALTNDVTHLFCLSASGPKYAKALSSQDKPIAVQVVTPHWFSDCFNTETLLSTKNYLFPNPPVLNPAHSEKLLLDGAPGDPTGGPKAAMQCGLLRAAAGVDFDPSSNPNTHLSSSNRSTFSNRVLGGKRVVFSASAVQNDPNRDQVFRRRVEQVGGTYISGLSLGENGVSEQTLEDADIFITLYRDNEEYELAAKCNVIVGTPAWILYITSTGLWSAPKEHLLHYPYYERPVRGFEDQLITITNYTGDAREYLKKLIAALGGKFTPSMTSKNTCVIASHVAIPAEQPKQNKIVKAREWRIPIVNHLWLEDSFREWTKMPVSDRKYSEFPPGHDWMQEINARGVGAGPLPAPPREKKQPPEASPNGSAVAQPKNANANANGTSPSKPTSIPKPTSTSKPTGISKLVSTQRKSDAAKQRNTAAPSTSGPSPSKSIKEDATKRKNDADTFQSTKRLKIMQETGSKKGGSESPAKSVSRPALDSASAASSSSFVKPESEVPHGPSIKLLSPEKGKRKPRKSSVDESNDHEDDSSSSSSESPARPKAFTSEPPASMVSGGRTQRAAATAAQDILRNVIMPDVQKFQNEMSSSKGDVRKMEQLAEKKQRRASMANHDNDGVPPPKKKKVQVDDTDVKPRKSQAAKSSQGKSESKKESEKGKSTSTPNTMAKSTADEKPRKTTTQSAIRIVCSKSKPTEMEIKQMERLGVSFTENPRDCTHLVVNSISRTEKFLCALPRCSHVITMRWIQDSVKEGRLQPESKYKLSDPENEQRYQMNLAKSLERIKADGGKLLEGHTFFLTDKIGVDFKSLQKVIESSGGVAKLEPKPTTKKLGNDMTRNHVISSQEAKASWQPLVKEDIPIYSKEFVLNGILRQELDWATDRVH